MATCPNDTGIPQSCREIAPTPNEWIDKNTETSCYFNYMRGAYDNNVAVTVTQMGIQSIKCSIGVLIDNYRGDTFDFTQWDNFGYNIIETCNNIPGLCDEKLNDICPAILDQDTPTYQRMCGCFTSDVCSAACNSIYTIQKTNDDLTGFNTCTENRCIIDNLSIISINSNLSSITVSQTCTGCTETNPCTCVFNASSSSPGIVGDAYQNMKTSSVCGTTTCKLDGTIVPCESLPVINTNVNRFNLVWFMLIIIAITIILALFISYFS